MKNKDCFEYFLMLLNKKDYSSKMLISKAIQYGFEDYQDALQRLININYVNDERYAQNLVDFYGKTKGKNFLYIKLKQKMIDDNIILNILENTEEIPTDEIKKLIYSKLNIQSLENIDYLQYQKIYKLLLSRGYNSPKNIINAIKESHL
jgi:SOS response regulatory protein OraA/RecX